MRLSRLQRLRQSRGFTLVELMIVVAIIGVLAALAIYGVSKYLGAAKSSEAKSALGAMGKGNIAAFNNEFMQAGVLADADSAAKSNQICADASATVPAGGVGAVRGKKYQSSAVEWNKDAATGSIASKGFACLKFTLDSPQYYAYGYAGDPSGAIQKFAATAAGDINNNNVDSKFELRGEARDGRVVLAPTIAETNPEE